jgi:hypothetical protein
MLDQDNSGILQSMRDAGRLRLLKGAGGDRDT